MKASQFEGFSLSKLLRKAAIKSILKLFKALAVNPATGAIGTCVVEMFNTKLLAHK